MKRRAKFDCLDGLIRHRADRKQARHLRSGQKYEPAFLGRQRDGQHLWGERE